jgi:hypothetical protein
MSEISDPRYPIGKYRFPDPITPRDLEGWMGDLERAPAALRLAVKGLSPDKLDTPYRPGGWTVRQVAHHLPDSHLNGYLRFKLALTEEEPVIKLYQEARWAELADTRATPVETSLALLEALHQRWLALLRGMSPAEFERRFRYPEEARVLSLAQALCIYGWHGRHHVAHITSLRGQKGW